MVLNMLTTGAMVRIGKTYGNLMVDLKATNEKLARRSCRIVSDIAGVDPAEAAALLQQCEGEVKTAIVSHLRGVSPETARKFLSDAGGHLRSALGGGPS
jgi:N-acetylmuramic acid 6-phosphate etherase